MANLFPYDWRDDARIEATYRYHEVRWVLRAAIIAIRQLAEAFWHAAWGDGTRLYLAWVGRPPDPAFSQRLQARAYQLRRIAHQRRAVMNAGAPRRIA